MEQFIVSARKYRPENFESVVGQQAITGTLQNAIRNNHLAQALLFCGPRGVGKTTCARILAKAINTEDHNASLTGNDEDFSFNIFELDAASNNSVEDIRSLTDQVRFAPQQGKFKIYIIDEVHMLSQAAFNAFLKTLEEPPPHAIFILATTEKHKIIPTILSRCQIFDFKRIGVEDIAQHLTYVAEKEGVEAEKDALTLIGQKADGAMRDALSIFDRIVSYTGDSLSYQNVIENLNILDYDYYLRCTEHLLAADHIQSFLLFNEVLVKGFDGHHFITGMSEHLRNLLVCQNKETISLLEVGERVQKAYLEQAQKCAPQWLLRALEILTETDTQYKQSHHPRMLVELSLLKICSLSSPSSDEKKKPYKILSPSKLKEKRNAQVMAEDFTPPVQEKLEQIDPLREIQKIKAEDQIPEEQKSKSTEAAIDLESVKDKDQKEEPLKQAGPERTGRSAERRPGNRATMSLLSEIKQAESKNAVAANDPKDLPNDPFEVEELNKLWSKFTKTLGRNKQQNLASTLKTADRNLTGSQIGLELFNNVQMREVERIKPELLGFLRRELNNYEIDILCTVREQSGDERPYTPEDKFQHLMKTNPSLLDFKNELDLEVDF
jgi:DNA polymerase-3 subunit gamma/tau